MQTAIRKLSVWLVTIGLYSGVHSSLVAQVAPSNRTPASDGENLKDSPVTLSPFVVTSSKDTGYVATNTLAGSRLNTKLADTPASISVMTKDFINDIAAISVSGAMEYAVNAGNDINAGNTANRGDTGNGLISNDFNFQVRGYRQATQTRDYFRTILDGDTYNIERIDVARGPNSLLFGVGGPSGVINTTTKQADPTRNSGSISTRVGSFGMQRGTVDLNQGLFNGRFGARVNLLYQQADGYHDFESDDQKRGAVALTWKPTDTTTIRVNGEKGFIHQNRVRPWTAVDNYTRWRDQGKPMFTYGMPQSPAGNLAPIQTDAVKNDQYYSQSQNTSNLGGVNNGLSTDQFLSGQLGNYNLLQDGPLGGVAIFAGGDRSLGGGLGTFRGARYYRISNNYGNQAGFDTPFPVTDESVYPRTSNPAGPGQFVEVDYHQISGTVEQRIGKNLYLEATANRTVREFYNQTTLGFSQISLTYDAMAYLPTFRNDGSFAATLGGPTTTGQGRGALNFGPTYVNLLTGAVVANPLGGGLIPNPYAGQQIITYSPSKSTSTTTLDDYRISATYTLDLGKLGKHNLLGFVARNETSGDSDSYNLGNLDPARVSQNVSTNLPALIRHIDVLSSRLEDRGIPDPFANPVSVTNNSIRGVQSLVAGQPYTPEYYTPGFYLNSLTKSFRQTESAALAAQSSFFDGHLVTTIGGRRDIIKAYNEGTQVRDPVTQIITGFTPAHALILNTAGNTYSAGAVYHLPINRLRWLSLFANQSTNFQDQSNAARFEDEEVRRNLEIGPLKGLGRDFGVKASLFDGRINATVTRYTVEQSNVAVSVGSSNVVNLINALWTTIQNNGPSTAQTDLQNPSGHHVGGSDTRAQTSEGWELELTANPTKEWRVSFNISKSDNVLSGLGHNLTAYIDKHRSTWAAKSALVYDPTLPPGNLNNAGGSNNLGAILHELDNVYVPFVKANEGLSEINIRPWNANLFTAYRVSEGFLKNLTLGGGVNYKGPEIIGIKPATQADPNYKVFKGHIYYLVNAMAAYDIRLRNKNTVRLQLNVNNLLDFDDLQVLTSNYNPATDSVRAWYYHLPPRTYSLSATYSF
jgi:outer membrane receptor protein involved in Fe transport